MSRYVQNLLWLPAILSGSAHALGLGELHVTSSLNEPLAAQIDIIGATPEELNDLRAAIANRDTFQRYGADRPAFLSTANFKVGKDKSGRPVLLVRSSDAFTEPLVSLLVDLRWSSGELVREYTLLLDPAISAVSASRVPDATPDAPLVASARVETARSETSGSTRPSTASPAPDRAATAGVGTRSSRPSSSGEAYVVARRDTLGAIARRHGAATESDLLKTMVAIFHANPDAFMGNINRLRVGATLTIPSQAIIAATPEKAASLEVHAQMLAWHGKSGSPLALAQTGTTAAPVVATNDPPVADRATLKELADRIAALQQGLAELQRAQSEHAGTTPATAPSTTPAIAQSAAPATTASPWVDPAPPASAGATTAAETNTTAPIAEETPVDVQPAKTSHGGLITGACVLLAAGIAFAYRRIRRRSEDEADDILGVEPDDRDLGYKPLSAQAERESPPAVSTTASYRLATRAPSLLDHDAGIETILEGDTARRRVIEADEDEESSGETTVTVALGALPAYDATLELPAPDAAASDATVDMDMDNSETHVNMPSGLHEEVKFVERRVNIIDVLRNAIEREPDRLDLRVKLMELYHTTASTNRQGFIEAARKLAQQPNYQATPDWERIVSMGRQIAPEDPLFALDPTVQHEKLDQKLADCA
jgi:pilus assembly protein FimV